MKLDLQKLKELDRGATRGPWGLSFSHDHNRLYVVSPISDPADAPRLIVCEGGDFAGRNNFSLIIEMRNQLPALIARIEELDGVNNFLAEGLNRMETRKLDAMNVKLWAVADAARVAWDRGSHPRECNDECSCGMDALGGALEALDEEEGE